MAEVADSGNELGIIGLDAWFDPNAFSPTFYVYRGKLVTEERIREIVRNDLNRARKTKEEREALLKTVSDACRDSKTPVPSYDRPGDAVANFLFRGD